MTPEAPPPTADDVRAAARRLQGVARRTPTLESPRLNERIGGRLLVKAECLQRTGSFKFRGAYNFLSQLAPDQKRVVAFSSGNHAQGVALAARLLGVDATIVMPSDAPAIKIANTKADGATVVPYNRADANRVEIAMRLVEEQNAVLVPPYDHAWIMAGQGTAGLELLAQATEMDAAIDVLLAPTSGGGLIGGSAVIFGDLSPATEIHTVEPEGYDDWALSLRKGERVSITPGRRSICDALLLETPGALTFEVNRPRLAAGLAVSDAEAKAAMAAAFSELKIVLEPSGATALAAVLSGKIGTAGRTVAVIASGGNVDAPLFADAITNGR